MLRRQNRCPSPSCFTPIFELRLSIQSPLNLMQIITAVSNRTQRTLCHTLRDRLHRSYISGAGPEIFDDARYPTKFQWFITVKNKPPEVYKHYCPLNKASQSVVKEMKNLHSDSISTAISYALSLACSCEVPGLYDLSHAWPQSSTLSCLTCFPGAA